jgi:hypothetical protein
MNTAVVFLLAFQVGTGYPTPLVRSPGPQEDVGSSVLLGITTEAQEDVPAIFEEREFMERLKGLSKALADFAATYKSGKVNLRKVKAVLKAMHELEKCEWFRPPKAKGQGDQ